MEGRMATNELHLTVDFQNVELVKQKFIELQSTITGKDAEILRLQNRLLVATHSKNADEFDWNTLDEIHKLRSLLKEVKTDSTYWYKKYFLIPGSHENITMIIDAVATRHLVLMEKLKQEGVE
jgi:hypothetical protein